MNSSNDGLAFFFSLYYLLFFSSHKVVCACACASACACAIACARACVCACAYRAVVHVRVRVPVFIIISFFFSVITMTSVLMQRTIFVFSLVIFGHYYT